LLVPILTRYLDPRDYGRIAMFTAVVSFSGAFTGLNAAGAVNVRWFDNLRPDFPRYVGNCLFVLGMSTMGVVLIAWALAGRTEQWTDLPRFWVILAVLASSTMFVSRIRLAIWQAKGEAISYGLYQISQSTMIIGLALLLVIWAKAGWVGRPAGQVVASVIYAGVAIWSLRKCRLVRWELNSADIKDALRFGVPLVPHTLGGLLIGFADRFVLTAVLGVAETGIYMAGVQLGLVMGLLTDSFNRAYVPWLFQRLKSATLADKRRIVKITYLYFVVVLLGAICFWALGPKLVELVVGERFHRAAPIVFYVALGGAINGMYYMVTNYIFYTNRTELLSIGTLISGGLNIGLCYWLAKKNGILGAAQAYVIAQAFSFLYTWGAAAKVYPMPWGPWSWWNEKQLRDTFDHVA
jgi:O-antigen/teichoic acid export membrane protein